MTRDDGNILTNITSQPNSDGEQQSYGFISDSELNLTEKFKIMLIKSFLTATGG